MIQEFVNRFFEKQNEIESVFREEHPSEYIDLVRTVMKALSTGEYGSVDPDRIHELDDGDYQGTLVFVVAETGYQPTNYWYIKVTYGSCSGCDTLQGIRQYEDDPPNDEQVRDYTTLALHIVQGLRKMED